MTSTGKLSSPAYSVGDAALAALAGCVANSVALGLLSQKLWVGGIFLSIILFGVGFIVLALAGTPMARKLAAERRDTLFNGVVLGAAMGSLTGTVLAGVVASALFRSPAGAFSPFAPLFGLYFGVVDGAVAGFTFVWLGRRKSASRSDGADSRVETAARSRLRWLWVLIGLGLGIPASAVVYIGLKGKSEPKLFPIAGVSYQWPSGTTVLAPEPPPNFGKGYVRYRSSSRYPDRDAFFIVYDGNAQEPLNPAGLPYLQMVTSRFDKPEEFSFRATPAGQVVCNRRSAQVGLAYPCGLSFVHRGARWQLHFGAHQAHRAQLLHKKAISSLETFRRKS